MQQLHHGLQGSQIFCGQPQLFARLLVKATRGSAELPYFPWEATEVPPVRSLLDVLKLRLLSHVQ